MYIFSSSKKSWFELLNERRVCPFFLQLARVYIKGNEVITIKVEQMKKKWYKMKCARCVYVTENVQGYYSFILNWLNLWCFNFYVTHWAKSFFFFLVFSFVLRAQWKKYTHTKLLKVNNDRLTTTKTLNATRENKAMEEREKLMLNRSATLRACTVEKVVVFLCGYTMNLRQMDFSLRKGSDWWNVYVFVCKYETFIVFCW